MLLKADLLAEIKAGRVDTVFRRWRRATVKAGGTLKTSAGVLAIDSIEPIALADVKLADLQRAGFPSLDAFRAWLDTMKEGDLCIIRLHYAGDDPREALRTKLPDASEMTDITAALTRLDRSEAWTRKALMLIRDNPAILAETLAANAGVDKPKFKDRVRKLKELGLTESLETGYRLSPRGEAVLKFFAD